MFHILSPCPYDIFIPTNSSIYAPCIQICKLIENYSDTGSPIIDSEAFAILYYRLRNFMENHVSNYMDMKNIKGYWEIREDIVT